MANLTLWHLECDAYADAAFSGEGARRYGNRWNSKGARVIYAAENLPLALLETLAGLTDYVQLYQYVFFRLALPGEQIEALEPEDLPDGWDARPPTEKSKRVGDMWVASGRSLALKVPSVVVPYSHNWLINPEHPAFDQITISEAEELPVDRRLVE